MAVHFSIEDMRTPEKLENVLRQFQSSIRAITPVAPLPSLSELATQLAPLIRLQLQAGGIAPINLTSLLPVAITGGVIEDTHSNRLTVYTPPGASNLTFYETDRHVFYISTGSGGSLAWQYAGGVYVAAFVSRPIDLGASDIGFQFVDSSADMETNFSWTGTEWVTTGGYLQEIVDIANATITTLLLLRHLTTNIAAAGFGGAIVIQLENDANNPITAFYQTVVWASATGGAENADWTVSLVNAGVLHQVFRITAPGDIELAGKLKVYNSVAPTDGQLLIGNTGGATFDAATLTAGPGISITNGAGAVTVALDGTFIADRVTLLNQTTAIGLTSFTGSTGGTLYRVNYDLLTTTGDVAAGTIQLDVVFTDDAGPVVVSSGPLTLTTVGRTSGVFLAQTASGSIDYQTTLVGIIATAQYGLYIVLERLT